MQIILLILGLALLVSGAGFLVRGATGIAARLKIAPLVIGLTVVAFGTSSPELAVSLSAALKGEAGISLGNVVGSNIFNVLVVLGLSALLVPLAVTRRIIRIEIPVMIGVSFLLLIVSLDGRLARWEGALLCLLMVVYIWFILRIKNPEGSAAGRQEADHSPAADPVPPSIAKSGGTLPPAVGSTVLGLGLLVVGADLMVRAAVEIGRMLQISTTVMGLTVVALGTSLPELATSVVAALRRERDMAVGNVVGSNLFNILLIAGLSASVSPGGLQVSRGTLTFDMPVMIVVALLCLPVSFTGRMISRWEGGLFLAYYGAFTLYLILSATGRAILRTYTNVMLLFVIPVTVLVLGSFLLKEWRARGPGRDR